MVAEYSQQMAQGISRGFGTISPQNLDVQDLINRSTKEMKNGF